MNRPGFVCRPPRLHVSPSLSYYSQDSSIALSPPHPIIPLLSGHHQISLVSNITGIPSRDSAIQLSSELFTNATINLSVLPLDLSQQWYPQIRDRRAHCATIFIYTDRVRPYYEEIKHSSLLNHEHIPRSHHEPSSTIQLRRCAACLLGPRRFLIPLRQRVSQRSAATEWRDHASASNER
jgi:hypothetical protein